MHVAPTAFASQVSSQEESGQIAFIHLSVYENMVEQ